MMGKRNNGAAVIYIFSNPPTINSTKTATAAMAVAATAAAAATTR